MPGPLTGVKIVELVGIGPGPFAAMLLADMGAEVVRVHRTQSVAQGFDPGGVPVLDRNRRSIGVDLKHADGVETVLRLVESADALLEGFRPGVTERLGLGPDDCLARNPKLVYGRMTGWGQDGPMANAAGHDINYIALAGALAHFGREGQKATPPINLIGDFGGGGMLLAFGIVCGVLEARSSGEGQVIDAAMIDGSSILMSMIWGLRALGAFDEDARGTNVLDTGAPFYDSYVCSDGKEIALGSLEPQFYAELLRLLGLEGEDLPAQMDRDGWPVLRAALHRDLRVEDAGRVVRADGDDRRVLRAGADDGRGRRPPPHQGTGHRHRVRGRAAARAGPAVLAHEARGATRARQAG